MIAYVVFILYALLLGLLFRLALKAIRRML